MTDDNLARTIAALRSFLLGKRGGVVIELYGQRQSLYLHHENCLALCDAAERGMNASAPPSPAAPAPDACNWHQDGEDCDTWQTGCGHYFTINDGTPMDNDFRHCCFCGKPLAQHPHEVDHDDE